MEKFIVMTAKAKMPNSCWSSYGRVAVVETNGIDMPKQINHTHNSVMRIVKTWEKLNIGGSRSAFQLALKDAKELAKNLNEKGK